MMQLLFWIFIVCGTLLCVAYFCLIASYCYAWVRTKNAALSADASVHITVIVAARNEETEISACLDAILSQEYPVEMFEVIVVDDHSTDSTGSLIKNYVDTNINIRSIALSEHTGLLGKKLAIDIGVKAAKGELIVTTDADCVMGKKWLGSIAAFYRQTNAKMIVAPVAFHKEETVFEKMQSLEFMALMVCGASSLYYNRAIMCNGANLAYTREAYIEVDGLGEPDQKASGDDVLLMYKISRNYPGEIRFMKSEEAFVYTKAKGSLTEFAHQRKRWASKGLGAMNAETKTAALLIYLFNSYLVLIPLIGLFYFPNTDVYQYFKDFCLILIGIKCFIDFLLLFLSASYFKKKRFLFFFLPEQIIYMLYITIFGIAGSVGKYEWKGRKTY